MKTHRITIEITKYQADYIARAANQKNLTSKGLLFHALTAWLEANGYAWPHDGEA